MDLTTLLILGGVFALVAALYTSVGHAGASGYLAVMALLAVPPEVMRPTALALNIIVASLATYRFLKAGQFNLRLFVPIVILAVPSAFVAARVHLPGEVYRPVVGVLLWIAAIRFLLPVRAETLEQTRPSNVWLAGLTGAGVGALSGLTGTGGGVFLSPILLINRWEIPRRVSGISSAFILCVSIAGLAGSVSSVGRLPPELPWLAGAVLVGALIGTQLGLKTLRPPILLKALGLVLIVAGAKLIFS